jgi:hypothetical protein
MSDERWDPFTLRRSAAVKASSAAGPAAGGKAIPQEAACRKHVPLADSFCWEPSASWSLLAAGQPSPGEGATPSSS